MAKTKKNKVSATALRAEIVEIANQLIKKYPRELRASKIIDAYLHTEIHSVEPERIIATLRKHHAKIVFDLPGVKNDDDLTNYLAISYTKNAHGYTDKQYGSHFQILNVFVNNSVLLSASDELKFLKQVHSKNPEQAKIARAELINANYRLVMSIAQHYCHHGIEIIDLFQEGVAGLGTAIEKFDYRSKNRLSTYATFWIRQAITNLITTQSKTMKLTSNSNKKTEIIHEKEVELLNKYGRYPTVQEIAEALGGKKAGFDPLTITNLKRVNSKSISLEGNVSKGTRETTIGELTGGTEENYENDLYTEDKYAALYKLMHLVLSEIEETVLCAKMGLKQFKEPLGYVEIAKLLKLKKDRVRQIEAKAKMKLKEATKNNSILKDD